VNDAPDAAPHGATSEAVQPAADDAHDTSPDDTTSGGTSRSPQPAGDSIRGKGASLDLQAIEHDLAGVETALRRLDDGSYWTDEVTGEPIPDDVLASNPVARRAE
jgi:RNA polymerase-binding transcription factor DksA